MPKESVSQRINASKLDTLSERELRALLNAVVDAINNLASKIDAESTLTAKDYKSTTAAILTK